MQRIPFAEGWATVRAPGLPVPIDEDDDEIFFEDGAMIPSARRTGIVVEGATIEPLLLLSSEGGGDMASQLAKLAELHAAGALSKEEFEASKAKLIGGS